MASDDEAARLRDALDHIMRVAREGIQPTKRLDWIEHRARVALEGKEWTPDHRDHPRNHRTHILRRDQRLRAAVRDLTSYEWWRARPGVCVADVIRDRLDEIEQKEEIT